MLKPLGDKVIIKRDKTPETTEGGIVIPERAQEKVTRGVVMAVGPGTQLKSRLANQLENALSGLPSEVAESLRPFVARLRRSAPSLVPGDKVLFGKYTGNDARIKDEDGVEHDCILCDESEVYGVIEE